MSLANLGTGSRHGMRRDGRDAQEGDTGGSGVVQRRTSSCLFLQDDIHNILQARADQLVFSVTQTLAPQITSIAIDLKAVQALFDPVADEQKALDEVKRLDGPEACLKSDSKLNDLAAFIPNDEDSAKRGSKSKSTGPKTHLSAAEIQRIRTPVEQLLERNLVRFESKIDCLVDKAGREHHTMRLIKKLAGARPYERIVNPV